jgi:hypothetical protein
VANAWGRLLLAPGTLLHKENAGYSTSLGLGAARGNGLAESELADEASGRYDDDSGCQWVADAVGYEWHANLSGRDSDSEINMNTAKFLADHRTYFTDAYKGFCEFGGPCVYFHTECLLAGEKAFLSNRHVEMLYATLTAWGMHRMGDGNTKLTTWDVFRQSVEESASVLNTFKSHKMLDLSERDYSDVVTELRACYDSLRVSESNATIVANSKALYHLLPELIPPVDRMYTARFFQKPPEEWRYKTGTRKFKQVSLPGDGSEQFELFHRICVSVKRLADQVDRTLFVQGRCECGVTPPKAVDNAIVNYIRIVDRAMTTQRVRRC